MKITAKTENGFFLEASYEEIRDLQKSLGNNDPKPKIDDVIPCLDYNFQIKTLRTLTDSYDMGKMVDAHKSLGLIINKFISFTSKLK